MKSFLFLSFIFFLLFVNAQTPKEVLIFSANKEEINLIDIMQSNSDTILLTFCSKVCKPCIRELNVFKQKKLYETYHIIVIAINTGKKIDDEKRFFKTKSYPFKIYYDINGNAKKYVIENHYLPNQYYRKSGNDYIMLIPQNFMFVNTQFIKRISNADIMKR